MSAITDIRRALDVAAIAWLAVLAESDQAIGAFIRPAAPPVVRVVPGVAELTERQDFDKLGFNVMITVGPIGDRGAEALLDEMLDPNVGLRVALEANRTLDGLVSDTVVRKCSGYQTFPGPTFPDGRCPGPDLLGATWHVVVSVT